MARQPQLEDGTSTRMQSAPINIAYGNQETRRFWRDTYRWVNQIDSDEEEEIEQNHHSEVDENQMMALHDGFSGGDVADEVEQATISISSSEKEDEKENDVVVAEPAEHINDATTQQKISSDAAYDIFEQLLAENERKLRYLISHLNSQLVLQ